MGALQLAERLSAELTGFSAPQRAVVPVAEPWAALFPNGGLARGGVTAVANSVSLALTLLAEASAQGLWCGAVGLPGLGYAAAAERGVDLARLAVVAAPGERWASAAAVLLDGLDLVLVAPPRSVRATDARRLAARVREQRRVLLVAGHWPEQPDLRLTLTGGEWYGLDRGSGRLTARRCVVTASGRGAAARERQVTAWLPPAR